MRLCRQCRAWAPQHVSDSENYSLDWLHSFLLGTAAGFVVWAGFEIVNEAVRSLSYPTFFWLDLVAAVLLYTFAVAGFRHSELRWPGIDASEPPQPVVEQAFDWDTLAEQYRGEMSRQRWYLDADLTLDTLAGHLSTNTWTLSRAINEGAGCNFNDFVNVYRIDSDCERLADPAEGRTLLEIALECGFNSKTSFNRSFKKLKGETPSECRKRLRKGARS